jgi:hypothetical protein
VFYLHGVHDRNIGHRWSEERIGGGAACRRAICGVDQFSNCRKTLASQVPKSANVIRNGTVHRSRFSTQEYFILYQENPRLFIGGFHRNPTSCLDDKMLPVYMRISLFYFPIHLFIAIASFATVTVGKSKAFGCI